MVLAVATVAAGLSVLIMLVEEGVGEEIVVVVRAIRLGGGFSSLVHFANHLPQNQQTKTGLLLD